MSRIGRTCSVPTDACAYHVPRVPCLRNTSVRRSTYSARCASGTAQSSMNDTGLPSPFMLIMMLRPALRTSHSAFCAPASVMLHDASRQAEVAHQRDEVLELAPRSAGASSPTNSTSRIASGSPIERAVDHRPERGIAAREVDHRAVDELHRGRRRASTMWRVHSIARYSVGKFTTPSVRCAGIGATLSVRLARPRERAFAADQQVRVVDAAVGGVRPLALRIEHVDVVAADAAQHVRHACARSRRARARRSRAAPRRARARAARARRPSSLSGPKRADGAVGEHRVDRLDVVHHVAVRDRARAAGVVARHAAQRRLRRRADVDREPHAVRPQPGVERIEHDAGLDRHGLRLGVVVEHAVQVLAVVDDERSADRLPALRAARAARQHRDAELAADFEGGAHVVVARGTSTPTGITW